MNGTLLKVGIGCLIVLLVFMVGCVFVTGLAIGALSCPQVEKQTPEPLKLGIPAATLECLGVCRDFDAPPRCQQQCIDTNGGTDQ